MSTNDRLWREVATTKPTGNTYADAVKTIGAIAAKVFAPEHFPLSDFNPDAMDIETLHDWITFIGSGQRPAAAKHWFPGMRGQFKAAIAMRCYCWNKITAIRQRQAGNIATAQQYETICEQIYKTLPECAQW